MIHRRLLAASALALPALGFVQKANAQIVVKSRLKSIQDNNALRVGTTGDFNPMSFRTVHPAPTGTWGIRSIARTCLPRIWA